jgi:hypothetical protein
LSYTRRGRSLWGVKKTDKRDKTLPYVPWTLVESKQREQRIAVICPVEEQVVGDNRVQEDVGEEVNRSETDVAEEEKDDIEI